MKPVVSSTDLRPETRAALDALRAALPLVQQRRGATEIREKARNDIVTATDVLVQSLLQEFLYEQHPDIAFLGEEGTPSVAHNAKRTWLVDPICGTTNYAAAIPLFATNWLPLVRDSAGTDTRRNSDRQPALSGQLPTSRRDRSAGC